MTGNSLISIKLAEFLFLYVDHEFQEKKINC
jgi:hypothetical protein